MVFFRPRRDPRILGLPVPLDTQAPVLDVKPVRRQQALDLAIRGVGAGDELEREIIFRIASHFITPGNISPKDPANVTLMKTGSVEENFLSLGVVINLVDNGDVLKQIDFIASHPEFKLYQVESGVFRELLFDVPELLYACQRLFNSVEATDYFNSTIN